MKEKDFNKGIDELKNIRMTEAEKSRMLENVLSTPIKSPYMTRFPHFAYISACLVFVLTFGGVVSASSESLPGDVLYTVKVSVVEPVLDVVNRAPDKKVVWETEKVERRIEEAEKLDEKGELSEEKVEELERKVEKSSRAFVKAVKEANGDRSEKRKEEFRKKFDDSEEEPGEDFAMEAASTMQMNVEVAEDIVEGEDGPSRERRSGKERGNRKDNIKRLKDTAKRVVDEDEYEEYD